MYFPIIGSEAPNGIFLPGDLREFYWGSAAFLVIMLLIFRLAGPPVKKAFKARTARIREELETAKAERANAEEALHASTADLPDVESERERISLEAAQTAAKLKADLIAKAEADAEAVRQRGATEVANLKRQALADVSEEAARLTRDSAEELVIESLDAASHKDLIDGYIAKVEAL